jgi:hypothetical protein
VGPVEDSTHPAPEQEGGGGERPSRRPRTRACLLKGCERRFRPLAARQRYCSPQCRQAARRWSQWKAQQSYRSTAAAKEKRQEQSRRYRERVKERKQPVQPEAIPEAARVITPYFFSITVATVLAAMRDLPSNRDPHSGASVHEPAGALWNASGSASGAGAWRRDCTQSGSQTRRQISLTY